MFRHFLSAQQQSRGNVGSPHFLRLAIDHYQSLCDPNALFTQHSDLVEVSGRAVVVQQAMLTLTSPTWGCANALTEWSPHKSHKYLEDTLPLRFNDSNYFSKNLDSFLLVFHERRNERSLRSPQRPAATHGMWTVWSAGLPCAQARGCWTYFC